MARQINRLTDIAVRSVAKPGRHADGQGHYLNVSRSESKSWVYVWRDKGRHLEMGLGSFPTVTLAKARRKAADVRVLRSDSLDQKAEKRRLIGVPFRDAVSAFLSSKEGGWTNDKHRAQWGMTLGERYCGHLQMMPICDIETDDVLKVLKPIWQDKAETASRLRGRIERVLDYATVKGWRQGENPARWRGHLQAILPAPKKLTRGHHAVMPYRDVPEFIARLRATDAISSKALEFLILTVGRASEVTGALWSEIDLEAGTWTIPSEPMKARQEHVVPLSGSAMAVLGSFRECKTGDIVFPGQKHGSGLSNGGFAELFRRFNVDGVTAHGFRSAFRDWAGDETTTPREIAEAALAHKVGNQVEQAYRRSTALEKRRALMEAWAGYLDAETDVVRLVGHG